MGAKWRHAAVATPNASRRVSWSTLESAGRRCPTCNGNSASRGIPTGLAAEIFASTLDVYLTLGNIESNPSDLSTADGRPATIEAARDRMARMVGADRDGFSTQDALEFCVAADRRLLDRLAQAARLAAVPTIGHVTAAVVAGSGEFLRRRLASDLLEPDGSIIGLKEAWVLSLHRLGVPMQWLNSRPSGLDMRATRHETTVSDRREGGGQSVQLARISECMAAFLQMLEAHDTNACIILIAGGGPAAELIRVLDELHRLGDVTAHRLALQAMELSAQIPAASFREP